MDVPLQNNMWPNGQNVSFPVMRTGFESQYDQFVRNLMS